MRRVSALKGRFTQFTHWRCCLSYQNIKMISLYDIPSRVETYQEKIHFPPTVQNEKFITGQEPITNNQLFWANRKPEIIFVSRKDTPQSLYYLHQIAMWIKFNHPKTKLLVENGNATAFDATDLPVYTFLSSEKSELSRITDFVLCLGGDGRLILTNQIF